MAALQAQASLQASMSNITSFESARRGEPENVQQGKRQMPATIMMFYFASTLSHVCLITHDQYLYPLLQLNLWSTFLSVFVLKSLTASDSLVFISEHPTKPA